MVAWETLAGRLSVAGGLGLTRGPAKVNRATARPVPAFSNAGDWKHVQALDPATVERLRRDMKKQGVRLHAVDAEDGQSLVRVWYSHTMGGDVALGAARVARALLRITGRAYDHYELTEMVAGVASVRLRFERDDFHQVIAGNLAEHRFVERLNILPAGAGRIAKASYRDLLEYPAFSTALNPQLRSNIGGPDAFFVGQLLARLAGTVQLSANWSASAALGVECARQHQQRQASANISEWPSPGSEFGWAIICVKGAMPTWRSWTPAISSPWHQTFSVALSAGIFEEMFGGVATEFLYRPSQRSWAVGLEVARVRQREFEQRLGFLDYETTTTLLSYYQELPWNGTRLTLTGGRFLAGDYGVQIELSRAFRNGVRFGVFATPTDATNRKNLEKALLIRASS